MNKASAEELSRAGDQYLGRSYDEMDCQEFIERCLEAVGIKIDLKGSNAWFRKCQAEGWTGTPEECVKTFGSVPKGAFLFIHAYDGGEERRGYHDGKGNASHIGFKTGRGDGAIHSSATRGCVATSKFQDKTVRNGGWNMVGLWNRLDYGKTVNWLLEHMGIGGKPEEEKQEEATAMQAIAQSENGKGINLRKTKGGDLLDKVPSGSQVEILDGGDGEWSKIKWKGKTGWMKTEFLVADDSALPDEDFNAGDLDGQDGSEKVALYFTVEELSAALPFLEKMVDAIVATVGRG